MVDADRLFQDAMRLPEEDREKLVSRLAQSLEAPDPHAEIDDDQLQAELERRADDAAAGRTRGIPWSEVEKKVFGRRKR